MATSRPMLGDIELQLVQKIETDEDQVLVQHGVPALEGDFLQRVQRRANRFTLTGVLIGPEVGEGLKSLRDKFRAAEPLPFVADIVTATRVDQVLIEEMGVRELAGKPERFEYAFRLREYLPPSPVGTEVLPETPLDEEIAQEGEQQVTEQITEIDENVGELQVQVILAEGNQDYTNLVVLVEGTTESGEDVYFTIEEQTDGLYRRQNVPAGDYVARVIRR